MLDIVIPDSGPLITFGSIDRLDLLDRFNCPIMVTDMVAAEIRRGPSTASDKPIFERWFSAPSNRVQTCQTTYGTMWNALTPEAQSQIKRQMPGAGEQSIREFVQKVEVSLPPGDQLLVLFEDDAVKKVPFSPSTHLLHSFAFMMSLEKMGVIASADQLREQVLAAGRQLARDTFERRAMAGAGVADWQRDYNADRDNVRSVHADTFDVAIGYARSVSRIGPAPTVGMVTFFWDGISPEDAAARTELMRRPEYSAACKAVLLQEFERRDPIGFAAWNARGRTPAAGEDYRSNPPSRRGAEP